MKSACRSVVPALLGLLLCAAARPVLAQSSPASSPALGTTVIGKYPYTVADVQFVDGMIGHHAQAIIMANWAPTHGAAPTVRTLCERIINAQTDEITLMSNWLKDRHQAVPEAKPMPMKMMMNGVEQEMLMPGMLSDAQMKQLDGARGAEFDRLFLTFMIQHHRGAITMVNDLFATPGAGQDEAIYKLASDVYADQSTEIDRMQKMILSLTVNGNN